MDRDFHYEVSVQDENTVHVWVYGPNRMLMGRELGGHLVLTRAPEESSLDFLKRAHSKGQEMVPPAGVAYAVRRAMQDLANSLYPER